MLYFATFSQPNLCATLAKTNWSHSTAGTVAGCFVLLLTLMDLVMFLTNTTTDQAEWDTPVVPESDEGS